MAVQLSIDIKQNSYDGATNSSVVTVLVIATYSAGSHNGGNSDGSLPSGTLYVNGAAFDFESTFNSLKQEYGYETIYATTVVIDHNVTNVVDCSATFDTGVSAGTISATASKTLSGSPSGGGGNDGEDEETEYSYTIRATIGEGTVLRVKTASGRLLLETTESKWHAINYITESSIYIYADVLHPEKDELSRFTCGSKELEPGQYYRLDGRTDYSSVSVTVVTEARPRARVHVDTGEEFAGYACYIDDGVDWGYYVPYVDTGTGWVPCN